MSFKVEGRRHVSLALVLLMAGSASAVAQQNGPLFSTPASRSTTGAPILSDPTKRSSDPIDSTSLRRQTNAPRADKQSAQPEPASAAQSKNKFGNWELQCAEIAKGQKRCQVVGTVVSPDGKQTILVVSLASTPDGKATVTQMAVPLGIALKAGVKIDVEGAYGTTLAVSRCTPQGCLVEGNVEDAMIDAMKTKPSATFTLGTPDGKAIPVKLPLSGFAEAYAAMKVADGKDNRAAK